MSEPKPVGGGGGSYEKSDINVWKVAIYGLLLLVVIGGAGLLTTVLLFKKTADQGENANLSPLYEQNQLPPQPRLQSQPVKDLQELRSGEERILNSYGWIDRANGVARIPVSRAIDLIVERGLPPKPETAGKPAAGPVPARSPK